MNRTEFIVSQKIIFLFNASQLKFGDQTTVKTYFKIYTNPKIIVFFPRTVTYYGNWYNQTKEEDLENQDLEPKLVEDFGQNSQPYKKLLLSLIKMLNN